MRKFNQLTFTDRIRIETLYNTGIKVKDIAEKIHVHISTVYRELKRGSYEHLNSDYTVEERYSPDIAEEQYRKNLAAKGADLKIGSDIELAEYIENKIIEKKYSPAAVLGEIENKKIAFQTSICVRTVYNYIDKGIFLNLTNKDLVVKGKKKQSYKQVRPARAPKGESIENRPDEVNERITFGNWEMDCVEGKKGTQRTLLVLTERLTRQEIICPMKAKTMESVVNALDMLEMSYGKTFYKVFQTITVDNGSEFADCQGMEQSVLREGKRTQMYYCHPYCSWERGSNENQNKMIRRHFPKGSDFTEVMDDVIKNIETWMNHYPRAIFGYKTSAEMFQKCMAALA